MLCGTVHALHAHMPPSYTVLYSCPVAGLCDVSVMLHGEHVGPSPLTVAVVPGEVVPLRCSITGAGATRALLGAPARFVVETRDEHGNLLAKGGHDVAVRTEAPLVRSLRHPLGPLCLRRRCDSSAPWSCAGTGRAAATSASGLGLTPPTSAPGLGSPLPHLPPGLGALRPHLHCER